MRFHPVETMRDVLAIALAPNGVEHTVAAPVGGGAGEPAAAGDGRVPVGARG
jgi:hypothetical protein